MRSSQQFADSHKPDTHSHTTHTHPAKKRKKNVYVNNEYKELNQQKHLF